MPHQQHENDPRHLAQTATHMQPCHLTQTATHMPTQMNQSPQQYVMQPKMAYPYGGRGDANQMGVPNHGHLMQASHMMHPNVMGYPTSNSYPSPPQYNHPHLAGGMYQTQFPGYTQLSPMASPSMGSAVSFSPVGQSASPNMSTAHFPDSPPLLDASQMLMSPSRFRKRRQLSPLITGYSELQSSPHMMMRRAPLPKMPVSPGSYSMGNSPKSKPATLVLPCFFDQQNNLRTHGHGISGTSGYYEDSRRNARSFLLEADNIDEDNITIVEIKQLLRRYCINATGKKVVLVDRIRKLQAYLNSQMEREAGALRPPAQMSAPNTSPNLNCATPDAPLEKVEVKEEPLSENVR